METLAQPTGVPAGGDRLLVVTDNGNGVERLANIARRAGFAVAVATGNNAANRRLSTFDPTLIALHFRSPLSDGINVLKQLRRMGSRAAILWLDDHQSKQLETAFDIGRVMGLRMARTVCHYLPPELLRAVLHTLRVRTDESK